MSLKCCSVVILQWFSLSQPGGIGDAVASVVSEHRDIIVKKVAVTSMPRSGKPTELLAMYGLDAEGIAKAVKELMKM